MIHNRKVFSKAITNAEKDCDIFSVMKIVQKTNNFMRNFLTKEQKILFMFDKNNIIDGKDYSKESDPEADEQLTDIED